MYKLRCVVQNYHWGKMGKESVVAELKKAGDSTFEMKENEHYAEYWFGTHPSGPSEILVDGEFQLLKTFLEAHPEMLGNSQGLKALELPFLSKVLSVDTALSIQAHPDKKLAEILHEKKPDLYKDDNHKPEMAYALGDFVAMCGFRAVDEIVANLNNYVHFRNLIGDSISSQFEQAIASNGNVKEALRALFAAFLEADAENALKQINGMKEFLASKTDKTFTEQWINTLISQYPTDSGVFAPLLLNVLPLKAGDAIYLGADIPHAYLSGNIVETMACSNNVVRAGLTPKAIDKETLIDMLTYECGPVEILHASAVDDHYSTITTPAKEFMIEVMVVKKGETYTIPVIDVPRVLICYDGEGRIGQLDVKRGTILFQAAQYEETICAEKDIIIYATHEKI